jgi:DNA (cytosine-5)-methyltransferase 1
VSVPVVQWIARRISEGHSRLNANNIAAEFVKNGSHNAAFGGPGTEAIRLKFRVEGPARPVRGTIEKFGLDFSRPLSKRAAYGFLSRLLDSSLSRESAFVTDLKNWCE